ncbi:hypothetical protein FRC01_011919 [Tulasnella sp. 417]|nr:hypothetical protein FRC01_011919 [Tulasnella sp. 417]
MYLAGVVNHLHKALVNENGECAYVEEQTVLNLYQFAMMLEETGEAMEAWKIAQSEANQERIEELSVQRENAVMERLRQEGWEDADFPTTDPRWQALAHRPAALTERIWRRIHEELVELLQYSRQERLVFEKYERRNHREDRFLDLYVAFATLLVESSPNGDLCWAELPGRNIIQTVPSVMEALEEDRPDFTNEMWLGVQDDVKGAIEQNQLSIRQRLQATVWLGQRTLASGGQQDDGNIDLNLVTSAFSCRLCSQLLWYDEVMVHTCCVKYRWLDEPSRLKLSGQLFDVDPLLPATEAEYSLIRRIVRDLGVQRVPTLKEEVEELADRCICVHCESHAWDGQVELRSLRHVVSCGVVRIAVALTSTPGQMEQLGAGNVSLIGTTNPENPPSRRGIPALPELLVLPSLPFWPAAHYLRATQASPPSDETPRLRPWRDGRGSS